MTETIIFLWITQSIGISIVGTMRQCGFFKSFLMSIFFGPLVGALYVAVSDRGK
jgi:hypothetical protein